MNFIFPNIWDNPSQLTFIFFRGVETTNQYIIIVYMYMYSWPQKPAKWILMEINGTCIDYEWHVELDTLRCLQTLAGKSEKFLLNLAVFLRKSN